MSQHLDARPSMTEVSALNGKFSYETVTNWDDFVPSDSSKATKRQGISVGGTATGSPFSGDNATFYGEVEGYPTYWTQRLTVQYATTAGNRNRQFIRCCLGSGATPTAWEELALSENLTNSRPKYLGESGQLDANGTYQIPNFSSYNSFIIVARRWGGIASVFVTKAQINASVTGAIWLYGVGSDTSKTCLNISTTGLITVSSTSNEIFISVHGINEL